MPSLLSLFGRNAWSPKDKHILVTGGSSGLGLELSKLLAAQGAHVTIVARNKSKLEIAKEQIEAARLSPSQKIHAISSDLCKFAGAKSAVEESIQVSPTKAGRAPDAVFCCAGAAHPGWFIEQTEEQFRESFDLDYWTAAGTAHAAANAYARLGQLGGKIIFVSSTLGLMGLVGYSSYAPAKHAIRGLADSLRTELLLYKVGVHVYFPGTIFTPGFETENKTKPKITRELEGGDGNTPQHCAKGLLKGVKKGQFMITTDPISEIYRCIGTSGSPGNGWILDHIKRFAGFIVIPIWRLVEGDAKVHKHRAEHYKELNLAGGVPPKAA